MSLKKITVGLAILFILSCPIIYLHADTVANYVPMPNYGTIQTGIEGKKPGDIISLNTDSDIAAYCDFDKQIVVTRTSVLCVYISKSTPNAASAS